MNRTYILKASVLIGWLSMGLVTAAFSSETGTSRAPQVTASKPVTVVDAAARVREQLVLANR